jgi:RNA recognition motif-containing protein
VGKLNVKKNKNGLYSFAFLEFDSAEAASRAIKELDQFELFGKRMRVYLSNHSVGRIGRAKAASTAKGPDISPRNAHSTEIPGTTKEAGRHSNMQGGGKEAGAPRRKA